MALTPVGAFLFDQDSNSDKQEQHKQEYYCPTIANSSREKKGMVKTFDVVNRYF